MRMKAKQYLVDCGAQEAICDDRLTYSTFRGGWEVGISPPNLRPGDGAISAAGSPDNETTASGHMIRRVYWIRNVTLLEEDERDG